MNKRGIAALVVGVSLLGIFGLVGLIALIKVAGERREARRAEDQARREAEVRAAIETERDSQRAETVAAFADPARPTADEAAEFAPVFDALGGAVGRGDAAAAARAFDPERMLAELERAGTFDRLPANQVRPFKEGMRKGISEKLGTNLVENELARWERTDLRQVRWSADRSEAVVLAIHRAGDADAVPLRLRWWLVRRPGGWKIYDFEDLHMGIRWTRIVAAIATPDGVARIARDPQGFQLAVGGLKEGIVLLAKGDAEAADQALAPARRVQLPPQLQAILELAEGQILNARGEHEAALARFDAAERLFPNMPMTALARGGALVPLGRHDEAIALVRAYQKEVGPDGLSSALEGWAYEQSGRPKEAADAYRRALDEVAEMADAFHGLRRVLPDGEKGELGDRLAKARDPAKFYTELMREVNADDDPAAADALLAALRKARPDDPRGLSDDVRRKVKAGDLAGAAKLMEGGLKAATREARSQALNAYLYAMLGADKPLEAYTAVPAAHAAEAFRTVAFDLEDEFDDSDERDPARLKQLRELLALHRKRVPADPWLWYGEGTLLEADKEYEKAAKTFAAGRAKLPPPVDDDPDARDWDATRFRSRQVACLFRAKKGLEAYATVGPVAETFQQLAGLYDGGDDLDGLAALLVAHQKREPKDVQRVYWQAHLNFRKKEYPAAAVLFKKFLLETDEKAMNRWPARDEYVRAALRTKPADAAKLLAEFAPEETVSLGLRAAVAADTGDRAELERLLADVTKDGGKVWFYHDEDFRRAMNAERYRDLREVPRPEPAAEDRRVGWGNDRRRRALGRDHRERGRGHAAPRLRRLARRARERPARPGTGPGAHRVHPRAGGAAAVSVLAAGPRRTLRRTAAPRARDSGPLHRGHPRPGGRVAGHRGVVQPRVPVPAHDRRRVPGVRGPVRVPAPAGADRDRRGRTLVRPRHAPAAPAGHEPGDDARAGAGVVVARRRDRRATG